MFAFSHTAFRRCETGPGAEAGERDLSNRKGTLVSPQHLGRLSVQHICNLSTGEKEEAGSELRVILGYTGFKASLVCIDEATLPDPSSWQQPPPSRPDFSPVPWGPSFPLTLVFD